MAELKLTEQQHAAVYDRGGSLLLSAAADGKAELSAGKDRRVVQHLLDGLQSGSDSLLHG